MSAIGEDEEESVGHKDDVNRFFDLLDSVPVPQRVRKKRFDGLIAPLQRAKLVEYGLLLASQQFNLLVRLASAMSNADFGLMVSSFTLEVCVAWMACLGITQHSDAEHLLALLVKNSLLVEIGSGKDARGWLLEVSKVEHLAKLVE